MTWVGDLIDIKGQKINLTFFTVHNLNITTLFYLKQKCVQSYQI